MAPPNDRSGKAPSFLKLRGAGGEVVNRPLARRQEERHDGPTADDIQRFSDPTRRCPNCKKTVYDDSEVCYHCGEAMNAPEHRNKPATWVVVVVFMLIAALVLGVMRGII